MTSPGSARGALTAALFTLAPLACPAQEGGVTLRFLSFPKSLDPAPVELLTGEGKTMEVEIPSNELSKPYRVPRLGVWAIGETVTNDEGESVFQEYGRAKALASKSQLLLLVRKGEEYADGFEVLPIDNQVERFGGGKFLFMNAAKVDIAGEAGGEKFVVKPGGHTIIKPKAGTNGRSFHAMFYFRTADKAKPFFSSKWPTSDNARGLIFFYQDPESKRIRLHTIRDYLE